MIERYYYNSHSQNTKRMQDIGKQTLFVYTKYDYVRWISLGEEKKSRKLKEKNFFSNRKWKKNSSDIKPWQSLPASWGLEERPLW